MKREALARLIGVTGLRYLLSSALRWSGVMVLNYHRIGNSDNSTFDRGLWSASADAFDVQMRFIKSHFQVIAAADLPDVLARRKGRNVLVTFDDGYVDNYRVAFPILKRHQIRAVFFIATGFIDNPRLPWWDQVAWMVRTSKQEAIRLPQWIPAPVAFDEPSREKAVRTLLRTLKNLPCHLTGEYLQAIADATGNERCDPALGKSLWMSWEMLREMRDAGMSVGGHTVNHPILANMSREQQWLEIAGCRQRIVAELNVPMAYFSYPVGGLRAFNQETRSCLQEAGVQFAFSYYGGFRGFDDWDQFDIRRVAIESDTSLPLFRSAVALPRWFGRARTQSPSETVRRDAMVKDSSIMS